MPTKMRETSFKTIKVMVCVGREDVNAAYTWAKGDTGTGSA